MRNSERLKYLADIFISTVDKKSVDGEQSIALCNYMDVYYNARITDTIEFMAATATLDQVSQFTLRSGDILLTKDSETADDIGVSALVPGDLPGIVCGYHLALIRANQSLVEPSYLFWTLCSDTVRCQFTAAAMGVTRFGLRSEAIDEANIPMRPLAEQRAIADYLDTETARIDALLSTKQRMIELFRARTDALVEDEIGKLRRQCSEVPMKRLVREIDQRLGERTPPEMLSVSIHLGVVPRSLMTDKLPRAEELTAYKMCEPDDIVLNRMRAFQGGVGRSPQAGIVSPDYAVLRPCSLVLSQYLHYIFRSPWFVGEMTARLRGIGDSEQGNVRTPRINVAELGLIKVPLPSVTIQAQLVDKIDGKVAQMRTIVEKLSHQIDLLREHRQALITAAVTGELKISVQEAVA